MIKGQVIGKVICTDKDPKLKGVHLLMVACPNSLSKKRLVAADLLRQAGMGDEVYLVQGLEAAQLFRCGNIPVDAVIAGILDK